MPPAKRSPLPAGWRPSLHGPASSSRPAEHTVSTRRHTGAHWTRAGARGSSPEPVAATAFRQSTRSSSTPWPPAPAPCSGPFLPTPSHARLPFSPAIAFSCRLRMRSSWSRRERDRGRCTRQAPLASFRSHSGSCRRRRGREASTDRISCSTKELVRSRPSLCSCVPYRLDRQSLTTPRTARRPCPRASPAGLVLRCRSRRPSRRSSAQRVLLHGIWMRSRDKRTLRYMRPRQRS